MSQKKRSTTKLFIGIAAFLVVLTAMFFVYVGNYYRAGQLAQDSLKSGSFVKVEKSGDITFKPADNSKKVGFIFYPGGKVEASAYAPIVKEIANNGYTVIIADMPFNLAVVSPNRADDIIANNKDITAWVIGGHSLGGVMAANYAYKNDKIKGMVFLASYPQSKTDFKNRDIKVLSLWGSSDKIADINTIKNAESLVPSDTIFQEIDGGNHSGFGDYGHQKGDGEPTITNKEQMNYTSKAILKLLETIN
jgi:hypothetical protein